MFAWMIAIVSYCWRFWANANSFYVSYLPWKNCNFCNFKWSHLFLALPVSLFWGYFGEFGRWNLDWNFSNLSFLREYFYIIFTRKKFEDTLRMLHILLFSGVFLFFSFSFVLFKVKHLRFKSTEKLVFTFFVSLKENFNFCVYIKFE